MCENKLNNLLNNKNYDIGIIMRKCDINNKFDLLEAILNNIINNKFKRNAKLSNVNFIKNSIKLMNEIVDSTLIINKERVSFLIDSCLLSLNRSINIIKDLETIDFLTNQIIQLSKLNDKLLSYKYETEVEEVINMTFNYIKECNDFDSFKYLFDKNNYLYRVKDFTKISFFKKLLNEYLMQVDKKNYERMSYYKLVIKFFTNSKFKSKELFEIYEIINKEMFDSDSFKLMQLNNLKNYIRKNDVIYLKPYISQHRNDYMPDLILPNSIVDLTKEKCITMDKKGTRSCDDAIILKTNDDGTYNLILCISDLTAYIKENSKLDKLAYNLGGNVLSNTSGLISIFPTSLSNGLFSLELKKDKPCVAYSFHLDSNYDLIDFKAYNALINVKKAYDFSEIIDICHKDNNNFIIKLLEIATKLKKDNYQAEQYHLIKESKGDLHPDGEGFMIIEQFKILLNSTVANYYYENGLPYIFYNQEFFKQKLIIDKLKLKFSGLKSLDIINTLNLEYGFSNYSNVNKGHQGLGKPAYAHMSVPLRKYSATFDQRLDKLFLLSKDFTDKDVYENEEKVKKISSHLNERLYEHKLIK